MFNSLFKKLFFTYLILIILSLGIMAMMAINRFDRVYSDQIKDQLTNTAHLMRTIINDSAVTNPQFEATVKEWGAALQTRITVIDKTGIVLVDSERDPSTMENHNSRPEVMTARAEGFGTNIRFSDTLKINMLYLAMPLRPDQSAGKIIRVSVPLQHINRMRQHIFYAIGVVALILLIIATLMGAWLVLKLVRPLNKIVEKSKAIAQGDFSREIAVKSRDEIGLLGRTINQMSAELRQKFADVQEKSNILNTILAHINDGIVAVNSDLKIVFINNSTGRVFNCDISQSTGKFLWEVVRYDKFIRFIRESIGNRAKPSPSSSAQNMEIIADYPKQLRVYCTEIADLPDTRPYDPTVGRVFLIVIYDITEQNKFEQLRKDFVANVSHELRTPLTFIKGYVDTLRDGAVDDKAQSREFLAVIDKNVKQLTNLVNDLLELSKLESQSGIARIRPINLSGLIERVVDNFQPAIEQKQHQLINEATQEPGIEINADPDLLEKAVGNLLDNAIKYTPAKGEITIKAVLAADKVQIEVADNGLGVPAEDIPRIFERFYRVDKSRSREMGGTGLGLAIVKHIVQLHKGEITVQSEPNKGSRFTITLPVKSNS